MSVQWPVLTARLVALLPTLSGWTNVVTVYDGPPVTSEVPGDYCTVGFVEDESAGSYTEELSPVGNTFTAESGVVRCQLVCGSGDVDLATMRTRAFGFASTLRTAIRADHTLGVLPVGSVTGLAVEVLSNQNTGGSGQSVVLAVTYQCPFT